MNNTILREAHSTPYIGPTLPDSSGKHFHHYHVVNPAVARQLVNGAISEENFVTRVNDEAGSAISSALATTTGGMLFQTGGSSSSSTDLSNLVQFYNDSADAEITAQWMELYRAQRERHSATESDISAATSNVITAGTTSAVTTSAESVMTPRAVNRKISLSATASSTTPSVTINMASCTTRRATTAGTTDEGESSSEDILLPNRPDKDRTQRTKNYSESAENLYSTNSQSSLSYLSSTSTIAPHSVREGGVKSGGSTCGCSTANDGAEKSKLNRSMDVLPRLREFRLLEKCCSVDLPTQRQIPSARLARSKEMPNIADVDDYD